MYYQKMNYEKTVFECSLKAGSNSSYNKYRQIGDCFIESPSEEHIEFVKLVDKISNTPLDVNIPYVFVCRSSGTGKTQLPFSFDIPLLYFLPRESSYCQGIYRNFEDSNGILDVCVYNDIRNFREKFQECYKDKECSFGINEINDIQMKDHCFETLGFLVEYIGSILKVKGPEEKNWAGAQILYDHKFMYSKMTIASAKQRLSEMFSGTRKPVIFFDELFPIQEDYQKYCFRMLRSLVRSLRLVFVEMTTNAPASELFMAKDCAYKTSGAQNDDICYLVYKLPSMCQSYLNTKRDNVIEMIKKVQANSALGVIDFLFQMMRNERPWFVLTVCSRLRHIFDDKAEWCKELRNMFDSIETSEVTRPEIQNAQIKLIENIIGKLYNEYLYSKNVHGNIFYGQGQFYFLNQNLPNPGPVGFINKHTAYFEMPNDLQDSIYVQAYVSQSDETCLQVVRQDGSSVQVPVKTVLPKFDQETLTGLCFIGCTSSMHEFVLNRAHDDCSYLEKYFDCFKPVILRRDTTTPESNCLEKSVSISLILATHFQSLQDSLNFKSFFDHFVLELQDGYKVPSISYNEIIKMPELANVRIPFCGPVCAKWNDLMYQFLTDKCGSLLGGVVDSVTEDSVFAEMYTGLDETKVVVTVESRLDSKELNCSELKKKLKRLINKPYKAPINILLVRCLSAFKTKPVKKMLEKHGIWLVKLKLEHGYYYSLVTMFKPTEFKGQVYILMDLQSTAPDRVRDLIEQEKSKQVSAAPSNPKKAKKEAATRQDIKATRRN